MEAARFLRAYSTDPLKRLDHLKLWVCMLWHVKQDMLEVSALGFTAVEKRDVWLHPSC